LNGVCKTLKGVQLCRQIKGKPLNGPNAKNTMKWNAVSYAQRKMSEEAKLTRPDMTHTTQEWQKKTAQEWINGTNFLPKLLNSNSTRTEGSFIKTNSKETSQTPTGAAANTKSITKKAPQIVWQKNHTQLRKSSVKKTIHNS
jgi:hypothetical protein